MQSEWKGIARATTSPSYPSSFGNVVAPKRQRREQLGVGVGDPAGRVAQRLRVDVGAERAQQVARGPFGRVAIDPTARRRRRERLRCGHAGSASGAAAVLRKEPPAAVANPGMRTIEVCDAAVAVSVAPQPEPRGPDPESRAWVRALSGAGPRHDAAVAELHALLLRAARFEVRRRGGARSGELDDLATQAADDALMAILRKLHGYRGDSRFTTWAYKFALLEAAVRMRRRSWQGREVPLEREGWTLLADARNAPDLDAETAELLAAIAAGIDRLTPRQRTVLVALALNGVPIDVLAERMATTRGALYKTLHDARRSLRSGLAREGLTIGPEGGRP